MFSLPRQGQMLESAHFEAEISPGTANATCDTRTERGILSAAVVVVIVDEAEKETVKV